MTDLERVNVISLLLAIESQEKQIHSGQHLDRSYPERCEKCDEYIPNNDKKNKKK